MLSMKQIIYILISGLHIQNIVQESLGDFSSMFSRHKCNVCMFVF